MRIITIPIISRGPQIETSIGIIIVLVIITMVFFAGYRSYKGFLKTIEENTTSLEYNSREKTQEINF